MARVICQLERIGQETGAAVLYLHHTSKSAALDGHGDLQQASRGASSLVDNGRFCANLICITKEEADKLLDDGRAIGEENRKRYVRYEVSK